MTEVIGVRFKKVGKVYDFDPVNLKVDKDSYVIVETARGVEYGQVATPNHEVEDDQIVKPLRRVLRAATEEDKKTVEENQRLEKEAFAICEKKIRAHQLEMKLVEVEYTFDRGKILFYFTADGRVDFRELVKDLASGFRTRIELRQIGVRDEAKMLGGLGVCGCPLCCATFLDDFAPVSINMAKDQGLSLNPSKISGSCGRLMCCLKYENEAYQDLLRTTPPVDSLVETPNGQGVVTEISLLRGFCKVRLEDSNEEPRLYRKDELTVLRPGRIRARRSKNKSADHGEASPKAQETGPKPEPVSQKAEPAPALKVEEERGESREKPQRPQPRRPRENRENRENREKRENWEGRENREKREGRNNRENRENREGRENGENRENRSRPPRRYPPRRPRKNGEGKPEGKTED